MEVNGRRIDLVVTGAKGRLAVECDGDAFHTSPPRSPTTSTGNGPKRAGWKFWRVRESEYYFDPDAAMESLWAASDARDIHPNEVLEQDNGPEHSDDWAPIALSDAEGLDGLDGENAAELDDVAALVAPASTPPTRRAATPPGRRHRSPRSRRSPSRPKPRPVEPSPPATYGLGLDGWPSRSGVVAASTPPSSLSTTR